MAKIGKGQNRFLGDNNPRLRINLKDMFGVDVSGRPDLRQAMGQAIIDRIVDRSQGSKDRNNRAFAKYSDSYIKSDEFKAFGKTKKVDLTLRGDMFGLMDIIDEGQNTITIGWDEADEGAKAHGHITGAVGKKRDFLGLNAKDINVLGSELKSDIERAKDEPSGPEFLSLQDQILAAIQALGDADG